MLRIISVLLITLFATINVNFHYDGRYALPDPLKTPGAVRTTDVNVVCHSSIRSIRNTTLAMKKRACGQYGVLHCPLEGHIKIDHLIPLELGGADVIENLWPQPEPDYHFKDKLENRLHELVCAKQLQLHEAQLEIGTSWTASYRKHIGLLP